MSEIQERLQENQKKAAPKTMATAATAKTTGTATANGKFSPPSNVSSKAIAKKPGDHILVDLNLDPIFRPLLVDEFKKMSAPMASIDVISAPFARDVTSAAFSRTYAVGSEGTAGANMRSSDATGRLIHYPGDNGLFGCVFEAWKNHWVLRTRPEDWWFSVASTIAKAVDKAAKGSYSGAQKVRELFVSHEGKETIVVELTSYGIYDSDYSILFETFAAELEERIKVADYAKVMQNDFDTSGPTHKIASQVNLMASLQEFFIYEMHCCGCGLRGLEMVGSDRDWECLVTKIQEVREILHPILDDLDLPAGWFDHALDVFQNLVHTRKHPDDPRGAKFWINILIDTTGRKYVGGGGSMPGKLVEVPAYDGWLIQFLTGKTRILAEDLADCKSFSGRNHVPMKICLTWCKPPVEDECTLVAGMMGYVLHEGEEQQSGVDGASPEVVPSLEPYHMWGLLLDRNSPLRM
jgi:Domain of unknown function (DUF4419)